MSSYITNQIHAVQMEIVWWSNMEFIQFPNECSLNNVTFSNSINQMHFNFLTSQPIVYVMSSCRFPITIILLQVFLSFIPWLEDNNSTLFS